MLFLTCGKVERVWASSPISLLLLHYSNGCLLSYIIVYLWFSELHTDATVINFSSLFWPRAVMQAARFKGKTSVFSSPAGLFSYCRLRSKYSPRLSLYPHYCFWWRPEKCLPALMGTAVRAGGWETGPGEHGQRIVGLLFKTLLLFRALRVRPFISLKQHNPWI